MLGKLEEIYKKYLDLEKGINDPDAMSDMKRYIQLSKDYKELQPIVAAYKNYRNVMTSIDAAKDILEKEKDEDMRAYAKEELIELTGQRDQMEESIRLMLIPEDPQDRKNAVVEIRAGTGGDEASIFAGDLYRMYLKFCETKGWKVEPVSATEGTVGGYKEVIFDVSGSGVYGQMKYESGVHRVQRVPKTETQGRVHTSAASVVILPEADEFDVDVKESDIRKDTFCSSGPGGQSVNTTYSAIRLTHIPTGIVVTCQNERSQSQNREFAMKILRARLLELRNAEREEERAILRGEYTKAEWGSQIRSYVLHPYQMVKDHRTDHEVGNAQSVLDGSLTGFMEAYLKSEYNKK